jgi:hypothetical protein
VPAEESVTVRLVVYRWNGKKCQSYTWAAAFHPRRFCALQNIAYTSRSVSSARDGRWLAINWPTERNAAPAATAATTNDRSYSKT